ncbi:MAG: tRNA epoxyqueuosine(34) reductase QueG [Acidobacteria bacterium]|nr:tRNA epoxyqueuosine(34) reductase QueG [Acidobacteriota bacterium]
MNLKLAALRRLAAECGFELAGATPVGPLPEAAFFEHWVESGLAGEMSYLTDHRARLRLDPRHLLPSARSVISVGKLYNGPEPYSTEFTESERGWISRYAWGEDYHRIVRRGLKRLAASLQREIAHVFEWRACVDTAPLLERAWARRAGLGWIGKNSCLINEPRGSWFFLGELLVSLETESAEAPADRCGSCTRCIDACPTAAIVPTGLDAGPAGVGSAPAYTVDSRLCISYFTIELRGPVPKALREGMGSHLFGCDICQDVCPWNQGAPLTPEPAFAPREIAPRLENMAQLTAEEFRSLFGGSPVTRARYSGFLRNVAVAMGNQRLEKYRAPLDRLACSPDPLVREHALWALERLEENVTEGGRGSEAALRDRGALKPQGEGSQ